MQLSSSRLLTATFAALLTTGLAFAQSQDTSGSQSGGQSGSGPQTSTQDPSSQPNINTPAPQQPAPPPADKNAKKEPGSGAPVNSPDTVNPKNSKEDVDAIGNRSVGKGINFYSLEKEIGLGKQLAQEVERSSKLVDDPVVTEYVNRVGQNLVRNSDAKVPFTIKVIDSDEINAFALPGGFFYVNSGLILRANEESELAGVMAHEIAHVAARHGTKQATKGDIVQLASIPAMIFIPYTWAGYAAYQGMNFLIPMTFLKFSRDAEREADFLGLQYMYKSGYDPNSYVTFFERIQADEKRRPGTIGKAFSTHPPTPERIENTQKEIARILPARQEYVVTSSEFDSVKGRLRNIMFARKAVDNGPNKPTLRTRTEQQDKKKNDPQADPSSDDDRPTLKRRTDNP
ncbi:MAG TPA: M48 family metallopeptidase [Candidatus Eisenbacteria bacterium]|jgi:predicted Zn-dependent protease|nr:M48 family metallopeptidase [Candidatus Eisenbacteria bacterium]